MPNASPVNWHDHKDYSVVTIRSKAMLKLLPKRTYNLTNMQYVILLANINAENLEAYRVCYCINGLVVQFGLLM